MRIQHNIAALNSYQQLGRNNQALSKGLEKLSSGYRINRAGDDAAGLAISEKMRAQITGLDTATKNANDGISLVQTAEGSLTEVHSMLNRMVELAEQSANGTYQDDVDRENLQKEVSSLKDEIDRISDGTNFNGINLLDGTLSGSGTGGGLTGAQIVTYKGATNTTVGTSTAGVTMTEKDSMIIDGTKIEVDWSGLSSDDQDAVKIDWGGAPTAAQTENAAEIMQDTINEAIDNYNSEYGASVSHIKVKANAVAGSFDFTSTQLDANSFIQVEDGSGLIATLANTGGSTADLTLSPVATLTGTVADYNGKFTMSVGGEEILIQTGTDAADTVTGAADVAQRLQEAVNDALTNYDTAKGLTGSDVFTGKVNVKLNAQGSIEFTNTTGEKISFSELEDGTVASTLGISTEGKNSMSGGLTLQIGDTSDDFNKLTVSVGEMSSNALGIAGINLSTQSGATSAVDKIKDAINTVSSTRGDLGAIQNRLEHTINSLSVTEENMTAAESRIRDVDMAKEMMNYTKNNILIQASQSMLAQANQLPQGVLQLLQ
jgi:flagellin